ncbi:hypothetical protein DV736_g1512, partial [Chaetothyriales sp. CBS 134916]
MARFLLRASVAASALSLFVSLATAQSSTAAASGPIETLDCYDAIPSDYTSKGSYTFQTSGYCHDQCAGFSVMAITAGSTCYCGSELPSDSNKASSDSCNTPCQGFDTQTCGGIQFYQLYLTGDGAPGANAAPSPSTSTSAIASVVTDGGSGTSKIGIAVGVVVGVVAIAAIVGGLIFWMKWRRRLAIEEEHRRTAAAAASGFSGGKSETSSTTDQRLDPAFSMHRRNSLGSIADEQDFSRRILQVRNPDRDSRASNLA